jgi:hypothetical protein
VTPRRAALAAAVAALIVSLRGLGNGFAIDDTNFLIESAAFHRLGNIPAFFTGWWGAGSADAQLGAIATRYYRPLAATLNALEYALFGLRPVGYHLVSALLHATTAALAALLAFRVSRAPAVALVAGLVFAVHPVQAEAVAAITYQTTLLAGLLGAAALLAFGRMLEEGVRPGLLAAVGIALLGGCLAKEDAFAVPLLAAAWAVLARPPGWRRTLAWGAAVMGLAVAVVLALRAAVLPATSALTYFGDASAGVRVLTMVRVAALYGELLLVPLRLCPFYDWFIIPPEETVSAAVLLGGAVLVLALGAVVALARRGSRAALGLAWLLLGLLPVSQVIPFIVVAAERFLYLPMLGFALAFAVLAVAARERLRLPVLALAGLLALYAARTVVRVGDWHDDGTINRATAQAFPETPTPLLNLADFHLRHGEVAQAITALEEAQRRAPQLPVTAQRLARLRAEAALKAR